MAPFKKTEMMRGMKEGARQIEKLQEKWPEAFPKEGRKVRPLALGIVGTVAEALEWNEHYARGVVLVWKNRWAYCTAVLGYTKRFNLDGSISEEEVSDHARASAKAQLARIAEKKRRQAEKAQKAADSDRAKATQAAEC